MIVSMRSSPHRATLYPRGVFRLVRIPCLSKRKTTPNGVADTDEGFEFAEFIPFVAIEWYIVQINPDLIP